MARPFKSGIDYFPLDVSPDDKFEILESEHGIKGFGVLIKLYQKIYANNYWVKWDKKTGIVFSNRVNVNINDVDSIINSCFEWEIFDKNLFDKHQILTSKGIQKRFFEIVKRRKKVEVLKDYLLVDINKIFTPKEINSIIEIVNVNNNPVNVNSSTQSKVKESKEENKKTSVTSDYSEAFERWWLIYPKRDGRVRGKKKSYPFFKKILSSQYQDLKTATGNYSKESFIKDPERFLANDYWKDFIDEINPSGGGQPKESFKAPELTEEQKKNQIEINKQNSGRIT